MPRRLIPFWTLLTCILCSCAAPPAAATPVIPLPPGAAQPAAARRILIWAADESSDLASFEKAAATAHRAGATHMVITDNLPHAFWQYEVPGDPYPAWYNYRAGLFKIATPDALKPYIPQDYARRVLTLLADRCAILRKYALQGLYISNEPQILPEAVFRDHPLWRGPRVDQPNRSRAAHFAPCVDEPEVLALYRQAMASLTRRCPEITLFRLTTTDAGSGLCWAPSLYPGQNGPAHCQDRPMTERVRDFLAALQDGARDSGINAEIRLMQISPEEWMIPTFADPAALARQMPPGTAIDNFEAGSARPYISTVGSTATWNFFYPVRGIPMPVEALAGLRRAAPSPAPRLSLSVPKDCGDLYADLYTRFTAHPPATTAAEAQLLEDVATAQVGPDNAETLLAVWHAIDQAAQYGSLLSWAYPSTLGAVHQRWLTRPFIPFPDEITADQKAYYRRFLFQAKTEAIADDLVDMQSMRLYKGWPGRMAVTNVYNRIDPQLRTARIQLALLIAHLPPERRAPYAQLDRRLHAFQLLCTNARDAVNYQAVLDYLKGKKDPIDPTPPLGAGDPWDRKMILQIARDEIDNSAALIELLKTDPTLIDTAPTRADEDITQLGPDLPAQLKTKIDLMNAHWEDYKRLATTPNP